MNNIKKYAQYNEENFLYNFFSNKQDGFLVDIGAADGIRYSNSRSLIESGWSGMLVEPNINSFKKLEQLYGSDKKIILENVGCSDESIETADFFVDKNDEFEQLSTFSDAQVNKCKEIYNCEFEKNEVRVIKTSDLLKKYSISKIDFLSVDTEAFDTKVINGIDLNECEISLICIEHNSDEITKKLSDFGYKICHQTIGNIFFSKK
jgi:FkbM family methyltransferase